MTSIPDDNIHCISIDKDFDAAQDIVKACFNDKAFRDEVSLGAVNSINWARILAQIVYYFTAYFQVRAIVGEGDVINVSVPTGNFGDILAGWYARRMGLPLGGLIVAVCDSSIVIIYGAHTYTLFPCILLLSLSFPLLRDRLMRMISCIASLQRVRNYLIYR